MSERDTFGPRLRRERERRGISLETLASRTNVSVELWIGLETNDFSNWPAGLFARAFIRDYAKVVGLDPAELVDDFCRLYPIGDRRALPKLRAQAELIGHDLAAADDLTLIPGGVDRRAGTAGPAPAAPATSVERPAARRWWWPKKASVP
jgi:transcriptional regulator with XRE-family HTH domain